MQGCPAGLPRPAPVSPCCPTSACPQQEYVVSLAIMAGRLLAALAS